jgi:hypothetical protein
MSNKENDKGIFTHNETRDETPSSVRHLTIHPDFFEKTAEEQAEQDELAKRKNQTEQTILVQDEFQEFFNGQDFIIPPHWFMNHAPSFYLVPTGKIARHKDDQTAFFNTAADEIKRFLIERINAKYPVKPKTKTKAAYKNQTYKNTAKKAKVSPIMMALINKSK